ncbi:MAG: hypothetical protein U0768_12475 [Anaerolineae bacterium]
MRALSLIALVAALVAAVAVLAPRAHSEDNRVGLVVQYGNGSVFMGCYPWTADLTGETLLRRAGLDVEADYGSGMGALICRIGPDGCSQQDCLCQAQTPPLRYWAYWRLDRARGDWVYSQQGSSNRALQAGDVDGWAWGVGTAAFGAKPPKVTFEQVCPAPTTTPTAGPTFTLTPAPSPTHTPPAPTATSVPPPVAHALPSATPSPAPSAAPSATPVPTATSAAPATSAAVLSSTDATPTTDPGSGRGGSETRPSTPTAAAASAGGGSETRPSTPTAAAASGGGGSDTRPPTPTIAASGGGGSDTRPPMPTADPASGGGGSDTRPPMPTADPASGRGGSQTRPSTPATPDSRVVAQAPAGATVDLSRLTPVVAGASRGAVEGFNSGAPVGYIAFIALVAGLGAVLWLRRRGEP